MMQMFRNLYAPTIYGAYPQTLLPLETYPTPDPAPGVVKPPNYTTGKVNADSAPRDVVTPAPSTPPAATTPAAATYASLPAQYLTGLGSFVGDPTGWYSTRGAEKQAQTDYYNMLNMWSQKAGLPLTPDDWGNVWRTLNAYKSGYTALNPTRAFTMSDAFNYLNRMLTSAPALPQVSYLRTGEI